METGTVYFYSDKVGVDVSQDGITYKATDSYGRSWEFTKRRNGDLIEKGMRKGLRLKLGDKIDYVDRDF